VLGNIEKHRVYDLPREELPAPRAVSGNKRFFEWRTFVMNQCQEYYGHIL
jgi:hypothetical protein